MSIVNFSVNNSVLVNMSMIVLLVLGVYTLATMPKEEMPALDMGAFYILVRYQGVAPLEMEKLIVKKIEDEIADVDDIDYITASASEGLATFFISMLPDADVDQAWNDINTELDKISDLPEDADDPVIFRIRMREVNDICNISVGGDFSDNAIREIAEDFREVLLDVDYVSKVTISGTREREIWVESKIRTLDSLGLSLDDLINAIRLRNLNAPGGTIRSDRLEFIIRTSGEFDDTREIEELIVRMDENGRAIRLKDVAEVNDTLEKQQLIGKLNGKPCVNLLVYKRAEGNIISVMNNIRASAKNFQGKIPGLMVEIRNDGSINVKNSMNTLGQNAVIGMVLVFGVLWLFIGWRNALFAAWGIPFTFLVTFFLMHQFDVTLNNLSLFALILVLGMIVDDAIVVLENVHRYNEKGLPLKQAVIKGTKEILWPVTAAVATTVGAFMPMLMMAGNMGKFMRVFPIVVSLALAASLFECLVMLPSHIKELGQELAKKEQKRHRLYEWLVRNYRKAITWALRHRFITVFLVILAFIASGMIVALQLVRFEFFPSRTPRTIAINIQTPTGTNLDKTNEVVSKIEQYIMGMDKKSDIDAVVTTVGHYEKQHRYHVATSNAEIRVDFIEADEMTYSHEAIKSDIRRFIDNLPGVYTYNISESRHGPPTGADVEIRVKGENLDQLEAIGQMIIAELGKIPGVSDLESSFQPGKKEIQIKPRYDMLGLYGITVSQISSLVNTAAYGAKVSKYRGHGLDEYDIVVRVKEEQIDDVEELKDLKIRCCNGKLVPLKDVADFVLTTGYESIDHRDKKRLLTVSGSTTYFTENGVRRKRTPNEITDILRGNPIKGLPGVLADFEARFPGNFIEYGGQAEQQQETYNSLYLAFGVALLLVFTILAAQFKSYVQPLIVMGTIPFAFIGVIFGLMVTGLPFSMMTLISVVALAGVVVNDSLVLVDFVNRERERGVDRWNSLINAGCIRLRPILLTTFTTIAGFMPIILSTASATQDWKPMAVSIAFGLAFATTLTLFVIPAIYSIVDSLFGCMRLTRFSCHVPFKEAIKKNNT